MTIAEGKRAIQSLAKSAQSIFACGDYGEMLITKLLPQNYLAAYSGMQLSFSTGSITAGTTTNSLLPATTAAPPLALYNPPGSGKNLVVTKIGAINISGTPAGPLVWNYGPYATTTAAVATAVSGLIGTSPATRTQVYSGVVTTGSAVGVFYKIACGFSAVASLGSNLGTPLYEDIGGDVICPPGQYIALATFGTGTTHVFQAGLSWIELPV